MGLALKIISGPLAGRTFELRPGMVVGRAENEISINDPKISGRHAKFETDKAGTLVLVDLGSTNGLRVDGKRQNTVKITPGVTVRIGHTDCEIIDLDDQKLEPTTFTKPVALEPDTWSEYFSELSQTMANQIQDQPQTLKPFAKMIKLNVVKGVQIGQSWSLGYGPRTIGSGSISPMLVGDSIPAQAFTLTPEGQEVLFSTPFPDQVQLNGRPVKSEKLKTGDLIIIKETLIEVSLKG